MEHKETMKSAAEGQNFCFPVRVLENERLALVPFNIDIHGEEYWLAMSTSPKILNFVPWGPFPTFESFRKWYQEYVQSDIRNVMFAIELKSSPEPKRRVAGVIGYCEGDAESRTVEIGFLAILTDFQRNYIAFEACILLLDYAFDPPPLGLGLKQVQARSQATNSPVAIIVSQVGGKHDGTYRWDGVVPAEKLASMSDRSYVEDRYDEKGNHIGHTVYAHTFVISARAWEENKAKKKEKARL